MTAPARRARRGFTLLEMMITLTVLLLLAGAVFGIFSATLNVVGSLEDDQHRQNQVEALGAWLKRQLLALPADGVILSYHRDGEGLDASGIVWGEGANLTALDLKPQANGLYLLRVATYDSPANPMLPPRDQFLADVAAHDAAISWRPLIHDVKTADWSFLDVNQTAWNKSLIGDRPILIRLQFQVAGSPEAVTDTWWLPQLQLPAGAAMTSTGNNGAANP